MRPPKYAGQERRTSDSISFSDFKNTLGPLEQLSSSESSSGEITSDEVGWDNSDNPISNGGSISSPDSPNPVEGREPGPSGVTTVGETQENQSVEMADAGTSNKRPRTDEGPAPTTPAPAATTPTPAVRGKGHNAASDGGFDSAQGPISSLAKGGYKVQHGQMMFKKVHRMKSFAIPYVTKEKTALTLAGPTISAGSNVHKGTIYTTTPLAEIPWQYAYFYLSPEEFNLLPAGSYIDSVHVKVLHTVSQTAYNVGSTEATTATTNHPKVMIIGKDLEKYSRGGQTRKVVFTPGSGMKPTDITNVNRQDFIDKQYGSDQSELNVANYIVPGVATKIPYYNYNHFCIYQPDGVQAATDGLASDQIAPGYEYFVNNCIEVNSNDVTWDYVTEMSYKFKSAPIGEQFKQLEIFVGDYIHATGNSAYYNARRDVTNTSPSGQLTINERFGASFEGLVPIVTYQSAPIEKGATQVRGDAAKTPARQPSLHIGMRAIEKIDNTSNLTRANDFVQANIEFEIEATMLVRLPSYPNRFIKPKYYNVSQENTVAGTGYYQEGGNTQIVTFGLPRLTGQAPTLAAMDSRRSDDLTEDGKIVSSGSLPARQTPKLPRMELRKRNRRNNDK